MEAEIEGIVESTPRRGVPKKIEELNWEFIKEQYENSGLTVKAICELHNERFGYLPKVSTVSSTCSQRKWKRKPIVKGDGTILYRKEGNHREVRYKTGDQSALHLPPTTTLAIRAKVLEEAHASQLLGVETLIAKSERVLEEVQNQLDNALNLKPSELQQVATSLERAASVRFKAIEVQRKVLGMDKDDVTHSKQVTQIQILNMPNAQRIEPSDTDTLSDYSIETTGFTLGE